MHDGAFSASLRKAQVARIVDRRLIAFIAFFPSEFTVASDSFQFIVEALLNPFAHITLHRDDEAGDFLLFLKTDKPLSINHRLAELLILLGNVPGLLLGIEVRRHHVAILLKCCLDILDIDIVPRAIHNMALVLAFARSVHAADGLDGADVAYLLVKKQRVELGLVKSGLKLVHHDNQTVFGLLEFLYCILFIDSTVEGRT